jgi:uncharacterized protein
LFVEFFRIYQNLFALTFASVVETNAAFSHIRNMRTSRLASIVLLVFLTAATLGQVVAADGSGKPKHFIYVLHLVPRLHDDKNWTNDDNAALQRHFVRFQHAIDTGELVLAGRTTEPGDKTFGIAIFKATDEAGARQFMETDPAVVAGLMTAELHPFAIALERKNP